MTTEEIAIRSNQMKKDAAFARAVFTDVGWLRVLRKAANMIADGLEYQADNIKPNENTILPGATHADHRE